MTQIAPGGVTQKKNHKKIFINIINIKARRRLNRILFFFSTQFERRNYYFSKLLFFSVFGKTFKKKQIYKIFFIIFLIFLKIVNYTRIYKFFYEKRLNSLIIFLFLEKKKENFLNFRWNPNFFRDLFWRLWGRTRIWKKTFPLVWNAPKIK